MQIEAVSGVRLSNSPAVEAYLFDFEQVRAAYEYDWRDQAAFARRAAWLRDGGYKGNRAALAAVLRSYNQALGAGKPVLEQIDRLAQDGALAVVTGQQPGILAGPAYSIYKAITAIHLARAQQERLGLPVVPVFWIAGEDHDWQEISWVLAPSGDGMTRLALSEELNGLRSSVGLAPLPDSVRDVMAEFAGLLPDTEFKNTVLERVQAALTGAPALDPALTDGRATAADWFGRLMTWLFEGAGLILLNSADPALRRLESGFFQQAIRQHAAAEAAIDRGCDLWQSLGYEVTVQRHPGNLNLFTYVDGERLPLVAAGEGRYQVRDRAGLAWSTVELLERASAQPELFSTNVVLRPVLQGALLPDLAAVCGPGEISYWGLYRELFKALGGQMPVVYPRESYTLVEPPLARIMEKQGLTLPDVLFRLDERRHEFIEREDRLGISELFERFRSDVGGLHAAVVAVLLQLDANLEQTAEENRKQIEFQISKLEEKAKQQHRKNLEVALRQYDRLKAHLAADGLQERTVTILPYLAKYGPDLVAQLLAEAPLGDGWTHRIVYLGS